MPNQDQFKGERSITSAAEDAIPVVKGTPFVAGKAIYVGTGGDLIATMKSGNVRTFKNVPAGVELNIRITNVDVASTAADILNYV